MTSAMKEKEAFIPPSMKVNAGTRMKTNNMLQNLG